MTDPAHPSTLPRADRPSAGRVRLQRVLADAGIAARRVCEQLIEEGHVSVNGQVVRRLPVFVDPRTDVIQVDGHRVRAPDRHVYIMVNKPERVLGTTRDAPGADRRTVVDLVSHPSGARLHCVGRLGFASRGMVLLTNDGDLAHRLSHPRFGVTKTYHATIRGQGDEAFVAELTRLLSRTVARHRREAARPGARAARRAASRPRIGVVRREGDACVLEIEMREAGHGLIEEALGVMRVPIKRLERVAIGPVTLRGVALGEWRELTREELQALRHAPELEARRARSTPHATRPAMPRPAPARSPDAPPGAPRGSGGPGDRTPVGRGSRPRAGPRSARPARGDARSTDRRRPGAPGPRRTRRNRP